MTDLPVIEANLGRCDKLRAYRNVSELANAHKTYTGPKRGYRCQRCRQYHLGWTCADPSHEWHQMIELAVADGKR